jgi:hypothetical protein
MDMLRIALTQGADIDKLQQLMEFKERWEANEARKEFDNAMAEFKSTVLRIAKNQTAKFETQKGTTQYAYATLDNVNATIIPALSAVGINHRWKVEQNATEICVTCVLKHRKGHSEETTLRSLADSSGGKNAIQSIGSAVTYLERYTLLAATGMAVGGTDDDGNNSSPHPQAVTPASVMPKVQPPASAISHDDSEPVITPRSRKGAQPSTQAPSTQPADSQGPEQNLSGVFPEGEVLQPGKFELPISKPQSNRYFAIMKSVSVTDEQSARQLASLGWNGSRDEMPKRIYNQAIDLLDPEFRFHQNK